jgi:hypothetical protein
VSESPRLGFCKDPNYPLCWLAIARVKTADYQIGGLSFTAYMAASIIADSGNLSPLASQIAEFAGAFFAPVAGG